MAGMMPSYDKLSTAAQRLVDDAVRKLYQDVKAVGFDLSPSQHIRDVAEAVAQWITASENTKWLTSVDKTCPVRSTSNSSDIMEWWRAERHDPNVYVGGHFIPYDKAPPDDI